MRRGLVLLLAVSLYVVPTSAITNPKAIATDALMALYTYNFAKFTTWPSMAFRTPDAPLILCIIGKKPFSLEALAAVDKKKIQTHPVIINHFPRVTTLEGCHIAFVSRSEHWRLESILEELESRPVLTVSDIDEFSEQGGMITLTKSKERLLFDINLQASRLAGLTISSKLIELARNIVVASHEEESD